MIVTRFGPISVKNLFLLVHTAYPALAHLFVLADLIFRKLAVLAEYDVETHSEDSKSYEDKRQEEHFHKSVLENEFSTDRLVIVYLVDDVREGLGHRKDLDLARIH